MIILSLDAGGPQADDRLAALYQQLNRHFKQECTRGYTSAVEAFSVVLRASGSVADFEFEGCDAVKLIKRMNVVTADLGMPEGRWKESNAQFLPYLTDQIWDCVEACIKLLEKKGETVDREALREDYQKATAAFLSEHLGSS